jgi:hypothetical protein
MVQVLSLIRIIKKVFVHKQAYRCKRPGYFTTTALTFINSLIPYEESSLPKPLSLMPPKGSRGSDFTNSFTKQQPA